MEVVADIYYKQYNRRKKKRWDWIKTMQQYGRKKVDTTDWSILCFMKTTGQSEQEKSNIRGFYKRSPLRKICCESLEKVERVTSKYEHIREPDYKLNRHDSKGHLQYIKSLKVKNLCVLQTNREIYFEDSTKIQRTRNGRKTFCTSI